MWVLATCMLCMVPSAGVEYRAAVLHCVNAKNDGCSNNHLPGRSRTGRKSDHPTSACRSCTLQHQMPGWLQHATASTLERHQQGKALEFVCEDSPVCTNCVTQPG